MMMSPAPAFDANMASKISLEKEYIITLTSEGSELMRDLLATQVYWDF